MLKKFASCIGKYKAQTILAPLSIICEVVLEVFIPRVMSLIIDDGISTGNIKNIAIYGAIMLAMAFLSLAFGVLSARFASVASVGFAKNLRIKLFNKVQDFSFYNVDKFSTASLVTRLTTDVNYIQNAFMMIVRVAVRAPVMLIVSMAMVIDISPKIALVFLSVIPIMGIVIFIMAKYVFPLFEKMFKKFDFMNKKVQENLTAIRVVKACVREGHETEEFRKASLDVQNAQKKAEKIMVISMPLATLAMYICMLLVIGIGGTMIIKGSMSPGNLMSAITYVGQILMSVVMVTMILVNLVMSRASAERIDEVLSEGIDITDDKADPTLTPQDGSISFKNVDFSYFKKNDNLILENLSLDIASGETIGIIGGTGSAKTTLVQLILRLYDVTSGAVTVGGHDVRDYKIANLRSSAAMVLQKNVLFTGTIKENLLWGNPAASDQQVETACKNAAAHDFIMSFSDGYDTYLGQGGVNVSGGQKQRLCIARALLKEPKLMILDDSTSAVDTATDSQIRASLRKNLQDTTVIIIAQRLASVKDADKIIIMNEGKIDAIGTHSELLQNNDIYKEIYISQQKGAED